MTQIEPAGPHRGSVSNVLEQGGLTMASGSLSDVRGNRSRRQPPNAGTVEVDEETEVGSDDPADVVAEETLAQVGLALSRARFARDRRGEGFDDMDRLLFDLGEAGALLVEVIALPRGTTETIATRDGEIVEVQFDAAAEVSWTRGGTALLLVDEALGTGAAAEEALRAAVEIICCHARATGLPLDREALMARLRDELAEQDPV